jgi:uncharacterized protein YbjT (DUF2867 family)
MTSNPTYLVTGAGGGVGSVSRLVVEQLIGRGEEVRAMVHRDDSRADALRELGAHIVVGDLTNPVDVASATFGITRMFFNMSVSPQYLEATAVVCAATTDLDGLELLVNMSQLTVSQMTATSTAESHQQRLHWLAEHVINWSAIPAVHIRPTVFLDNPLFTVLAARSIRESNQLALPFGTGRTSPIAATDVADAVTAVLIAPENRAGHIYELTGPAVLNLDELAAQYAAALARPIRAVRLPYARWLDQLNEVGLDPYVQQHMATVARLHSDDRYNRLTTDLPRLTGHPAQSVEQYIRLHRNQFGPTTDPTRQPEPPRETVPATSKYATHNER